MSRPGNPYDNASCENFLRTLKREEIHANDYQDLGHLYANVEAFLQSAPFTSLLEIRRSRSEPFGY